MRFVVKQYQIVGPDKELCYCCADTSSCVRLPTGQLRYYAALPNTVKFQTVLILLFSLPVLLLGIIQSWKGFISNWWPQVPPTDLKFNVIKSSIDDSQFWTPTVEGNYSFLGDSYKLNRIQFGDCGVSSESKAQKIIKKFKSVSVVVYVNPSAPKEHVLFPGVTRRALFMVLLGLFFCLIAGLTEKEFLPVEGSWPAGL